ncbi:MAG: GyrI-like domain-containing protein [Anaerolineaceae bacterium]|nr:GyrI-like domain-containing protein [Anaerolineaceae bacterium]
MPPNNNIHLKQNLQKLIDFIEVHLEEELTLEQLAIVIGYSPYHLHHIFTAFTGESLGGYIRKRRLSLAVRWLQQSSMRITDIALRCGYQTPAAFSKGFRQAFGITPSELRKNKPFLLLHDQLSIKVDIARSIEMEFKIIERSEQRVLTVERKGQLNNDFTVTADKAFNILDKFIDDHNLRSFVGYCLGITPDDTLSATPEENRYIAGYFITREFPVPEHNEVKQIIFPVGKFAVFEHHGEYETLWKTWKAIYHEWLPQSEYTPRDAMPFEVYVKNKFEYKKEEMLTEIYIPIE